jgi:lysophospholipase L1-like esterase
VGAKEVARLPRAGFISSMSINLYLALGDSMSSDHYPTCDLRNLDAPPSHLDPAGAAALLFRNDDARWPEFRGQDLARLAPGVDFRNLTEDGALIDDVRTEELSRLGRDSADPRVLVTLTAGGNDLLDALLAGVPLGRAVDRIVRRYTDLIDTLLEELPQATLALTTVYDPTDGTGLFPGLSDARGRLPLEYLDHFNQHIRDTAARTPNALLADVHQRFLGHGVSVGERERWYWRYNLIEPNARGASEIRRVWWECLSNRLPPSSNASPRPAHPTLPAA